MENTFETEEQLQPVAEVNTPGQNEQESENDETSFEEEEFDEDEEAEELDEEEADNA